MAFLGLSGGELFVTVFIVFMVVSAAYWPRLGAALAVALVSKGRGDRAAVGPAAEAPPRGNPGDG